MEYHWITWPTLSEMEPLSLQMLSSKILHSGRSLQKTGHFTPKRWETPHCPAPSPLARGFGRWPKIPILGRADESHAAVRRKCLLCRGQNNYNAGLGTFHFVMQGLLRGWYWPIWKHPTYCNSIARFEARWVETGKDRRSMGEGADLLSLLIDLHWFKEPFALWLYEVDWLIYQWMPLLDLRNPLFGLHMGWESPSLNPFTSARCKGGSRV